MASGASAGPKGRGALAHLLQAAYWLVSAYHLYVCWTLHPLPPHDPIEFLVTKPLLMPLLALWFGAARAGPSDVPSGAVYGALLFSFLGDVFLMIEGKAWFLAGMGAFGAAHLCFIWAFISKIDVRRHAQLSRLIYVLPLFVYGFVVFTRLRLEGTLQVIVVGYMALLISNAFSAFIRRITIEAPSSASIFVGGWLFVQSDSMIALGNGDWSQPPLPYVKLAVMSTYIIGQYLIVRGCVVRSWEMAGAPSTAPATEAPPGAASRAALPS